jgi:hypothetical protein
MNLDEILTWGLRLTGVGQLFIAGLTFWLRKVIGWREDLAKLRPFNRCVVSTYGWYIQTINAIFGLICLLQPHELLTKTPLAADLTLMMAVYWLGRLTLGFIYYDTSEYTKQRKLYFYGNWAFTGLFAAQITALLGALAYNLGWLAG